MDISAPLEQIQSSFRFACSLTNSTILKQKFPRYEYFSFDKRKCRAPFSHFRCSILDHGLRPRPMPKPFKRDEKIFKEDTENISEDTQMANSSSCSGIGGQIEKLVLCKRYHEALELFEILECDSYFNADNSTYDALMSACIGLRSIRGVKRVFNHMLNSEVGLDLYMMNRVLAMHVKCGMMIDAHQLFGDMPERNLVSWNTMIGGLVDSGNYLGAFRLFLIMWEELSDAGSRTVASMIRASAGLELICIGQQLHSCALKLGVSKDIFVSCTLIDMYSKCGNIEDARLVFDEMPEKTTVGWNSIIAGYAFNGYSEEALGVYYEMQDSGTKMDHFTYTNILAVCTRLASLEHAKHVHAGLVRNGFESDIVANTALVDFYSKWGRIEDARNVFEKMPQKNIRSWNALISGYGYHGRGAEAVELFERMVHERMVPSHVTFLAVLSACSYSGLSDRGWEIFESMSRDYKVKPRAKHCACMVELLGKEGLLDEALAFIRDAPFRPTKNMWAALLTACRAHNNFVLGKHAIEQLYEMEPEKLSNYIVLLNIYNGAGKLDKVAEVVQTLRKKGMRMVPACTWIEIKKQPNAFCTGDKSHPQTKDIYDNLDYIMLQISRHGYAPEGNNMLADVDEREQSMILHHSEKLAISFGLINTPNSTPLQLVQSHRICNDCHNAIKLISLVSKRKLVFRDASRFHRFEDGRCSCGDYW